MSSLDSALNSLSAASMKDFIGRGRDLQPATELRLSKYTSIGWGVILIGLALVADRIAEGTVVEMINRVGSAFYGPILAAFLTGVLSSRATGAGVVAGVLPTSSPPAEESHPFEVVVCHGVAQQKLSDRSRATLPIRYLAS